MSLDHENEKKPQELIGGLAVNGKACDGEMSKYQKLHLRILSIALIFSFSTALLFVFQFKNNTDQTKRNTEALGIQKRALEAQTWQLILQQMSTIDKLFIENPDLYPYFFQGKKIHVNEKIYAKVKSMAVMILDFMDGFDDDYVRKLPGMEENGKYWTTWENYFTDQFNLSPVLCDSYKETASWYVKNGVIAKFAAKGCSHSGP